MTKPKTLPEKKATKLRTLTDAAITVVRRDKVAAFTKGWLGQTLAIDRTATSQIIAQLKKDEFIHNDTTNWGDFRDPRNRGKYYHVREAPPRWIGGNDGWKAHNGRKPGEK